jgi:hypothetical protein
MLESPFGVLAPGALLADDAVGVLQMWFQSCCGDHHADQFELCLHQRREVLLCVVVTATRN